MPLILSGCFIAGLQDCKLCKLYKICRYVYICICVYIYVYKPALSLSGTYAF